MRRDIFLPPLCVALSALSLSYTLKKSRAVDAGSRQPTAAQSDGGGNQGSIARPAAEENLVLKLADVESVSAVYLPSNAPTVNVTVRGLLNDGATRVHDIQRIAVPNGLTISVLTSRPRNAAATMALIPFEREITVDVSGQPAGAFAITVNGMGTSVTIP